MPLSDHNNGDDDDSRSSQSDPEDSIMEAHHDEETGPRGTGGTSGEEVVVRRQRVFLEGLRANQTKWVRSKRTKKRDTEADQSLPDYWNRKGKNPLQELSKGSHAVAATAAACVRHFSF